MIWDIFLANTKCKWETLKIYFQSKKFGVGSLFPRFASPSISQCSVHSSSAPACLLLAAWAAFALSHTQEKRLWVTLELPGLEMSVVYISETRRASSSSPVPTSGGKAPVFLLSVWLPGVPGGTFSTMNVNEITLNTDSVSLWWSKWLAAALMRKLVHTVHKIFISDILCFLVSGVTRSISRDRISGLPDFSRDCVICFSFCLLWQTWSFCELWHLIMLSKDRDKVILTSWKRDQ